MTAERSPPRLAIPPRPSDGVASGVLRREGNRAAARTAGLGRETRPRPRPRPRPWPRAPVRTDMDIVLSKSW